MSLPADTCWIQAPDHLRTCLSGTLVHQGRGRIGLDTEFIRERTWWPHLAVVQVALERADTGPLILLIDAQCPGMLEPLRPLLTNPHILKIMHSASEDLIALHHACGVLPAPLFDTQTAAALAGVGAGMGYQRLLGELLGVLIDKGQTRSDWTRRPLSDAQLRYAAEDVRYLFELHTLLQERLHLLDRMPWLEEDCARQLSTYSEEGERWPHLALRGAQALDHAGQVRLLRVLRWRDTQARRRDLPRNWILDNGLALQLAAGAARDQRTLQQQLDASPKAPRSRGAAIWAALNTPLPDETNLPLAQAEDHDKKEVLKQLQQTVAARSAELGLPDGVLASRRGLLALLDASREWSWGGQTDAGAPGPCVGEAHWPDALSGWRRAELEPLLVPLLPPPT